MYHVTCRKTSDVQCVLFITNYLSYARGLINILFLSNFDVILQFSVAKMTNF